MRNLTIDIALSLLLATEILLWHNRPASPIHLEFSSATATEITPQEPCIVLFWDWRKNIQPSSHTIISTLSPGAPRYQCVFHPQHRSHPIGNQRIPSQFGCLYNTHVQ